MRRIFGAIGVSLAVGGAAALTPLFATVGAALTLTAAAAGYRVWRWLRARNRREAPLPPPGGRHAPYGL